MSEEDLMDGIRAKGRDNARTPMQWDDTKEAGFTTGKPWIGVNPNYKVINAKAELEDKNSVFYYYQKLIQLRRNSQWSDIIVYGTYNLLDKEDENIFAYTRQLGDRKILVVCNVSANEVQFKLDFEVEGKACLIRNCDNLDLEKEMRVPAWFAGVWEI